MSTSRPQPAQPPISALSVYDGQVLRGRIHLRDQREWCAWDAQDRPLGVFASQKLAVKACCESERS